MTIPELIDRRSRSTRFLWAASLGWGYQLFAMVVGLWLTKYLLGRLGGSIMGWWTHALVMVSYITVIDLGLTALLPRDIAKETGSAGSWNRATGLPPVIGKWMKFAVLQFPIAMLIAFVGVIVMSRNDESHSLAAACVMGLALLMYPFRIGGLVINGLQDFRFEGLVQIVTYITGVVITIVLSNYFLGPIALIGGWASQIILSNFLVWIRLFVRYSSLLPSIQQIRTAATPIGMLGAGIWSWMAGIGVTLTGTSEILAIGCFSKESDLFNYACTTKLVTVLTPFALTIGAAMIPGLTELRCKGDTAAMERATVVYCQMILGISGLFGCVIVTLNPAFLEWWLHGNRYFGGFVTCFAIFGMNLKHFFNSLAIAMFSYNLERALWQLTFVSGVMSVFLTLTLVKLSSTRFAVMGPACVMVVVIPVALYMIRTKSPELALRLTKSFVMWSSAYALAILFCYFCIQQYSGPHFWSLVAVGFASSLCYGIAMLIPGFRSDAWNVIKELPQLAFLKIT